MLNRKIILKKVKVHNLKSVNLTLDTNELVVFTGVSGSGKSSLAFDTIYTEGQRRYVESLSTFARRQLGEMAKPDLEHASGISPTISIEQKTAGRNPRSTVGTMTEIYDFLRVLYARVAIAHCPVSGERVTPQSKERIIKTVQNYAEGTKIIIYAPYAKSKKGEFKEDFQELLRKGYTRLRVDGKLIEISDEVSLDKSASHDIDVVVDRIAVRPGNLSRVAESITNALNFGEGVCSVFNAEKDIETLFSQHAYSEKSGLSYRSLEPQDFSFNSPAGMCERCNGLGEVLEFDLDKVIDKTLSIAQDCCSVASSYGTVRYGNIYDNLAKMGSFDVHTAWEKLSNKAKELFLYGTKKKWTRMRFVHPVTGAVWFDFIRWQGVLHEARKRYEEAKSDRYRKKMESLMHIQKCPVCHGERLKPYPASALVGGKPIGKLTQMTIGDALSFFNDLKLSETEEIVAQELLKEIKERLRFLMEVGLHYLSLDRTAPTLSGGEAQRVRLASQIGCGLVGITYVLDEPSIGLHHRDNMRLVRTLKHLRDMGNTVIVVEHDEETIWAADRVVDFGPGPGHTGGEILVNGSHKDLLECKESLTAAYLSGKKMIAVPKVRKKAGKEAITIKGASHHNLKNVDVKFPLGLFIAVTGVSGSGKSSLVTETLYPALSNMLHRAEHPVGKHKKIEGLEHVDKVIAIDQSPIGRNPRSNPGTYIKVLDEIRVLFSGLPESRARGYKPGRFSFNVKDGTCSECKGMGMIRIDMDFMEDEWVDCPVCCNMRFDPETLSVYFKGKNIADVLEMEVYEAFKHFEHIPSIAHKLSTLIKVGMGYIKLGQSSTTLSGGEAQRIKLSRELVRPPTGKTIYILDEPTTGLHFHDIKHLLDVLKELVDHGNTIVVIEHNMDIVKTADWIIDIGPEGGAEGGQVVAAGTPEQVAKQGTPTGIAINEALFHDYDKKIQDALFRTKEAKKRKKRQEDVLIKEISVMGAAQNNLKHLDLAIPREKITVCTGPSGSGKSSLAFDTIYAEGQRRYIESLSPYARQFVKQMSKPQVGLVEGLSPAVSIEQKIHAGNPRSTVGTMTEIYDFLRILYAKIGIPHDPETKQVIRSISKETVAARVLSWKEGEKIQVLAPIEMKKSDSFSDVVSKLQKRGFVRLRLNGEYFEIDDKALLDAFDRKRQNELMLVIDRLIVKQSIKQRLFEACEQAAKIGKQKLVIAKDNEDVFFNLAFAVESTGKSFPEITPHIFAFNTKEGMCPDCQGLGIQYGASLTRFTEILSSNAKNLMRFLWGEKQSRKAMHLFETFLKEEKIEPLTALVDLPKEQLHILFQGSEQDKWYKSHLGFEFRWPGVNHVLARAGKSSNKELKTALLPVLDEVACFSCQGARINPLAKHVTINKTPIHILCEMPIDDAYRFIQEIKLDKQDKKVLDEVMSQLNHRLKFLNEVGLHYLSLNRKAPTLSGGEAQRIRLARQLGSGLTGVLYVLDEPTIGLHPKDNERLNQALLQLKELGNTLLMVEHDPQSIKIADLILDFGPGSGESGGHIVAKGSYKQILNNGQSLTGQYLSNKKTIPVPEKRRTLDKGSLHIKNASLHNLKNVSLNIPAGAMTCLTGVSGSGKSTLLMDIILPAVAQGIPYFDAIDLNGKAQVTGIDQFDKILSIDQNPIGHTVRSDVSTYVDVLTPIRQFFASLPNAKTKGLNPKHFSCNHRKGMCTACFGMGYKKVEMFFLPAIKMTCDECSGLRLNPLSLEIAYDGLNLGQWLQKTVVEVKEGFKNHPRIRKILDTLISVGLGYLKLGQQMVTLSGGEAQRIKLSRELSKRSTGNTLYLLDEPTTGLHQDDINKLLKVLHKLVDKGNSVVFIEHQLDMIKNADFVIDLGPEAGEKGGEIVFAGTPEDMVKHTPSATGRYLSEVLSRL